MDLLVNNERLFSFIRSFYELTHVKTTIFNTTFDVICHYPPYNCTFCNEIQQSSLGRLYCTKCNLASFIQCKQTGSCYVYKCHMGLVESTTLIKSGNIIVGYLMFGQLIDEADEPNFLENLPILSREYGLDLERMQNYQKDIMRYSTQQIYAMGDILDACASYICASDLVALDGHQRFFQLNEYLQKHFTANITSSDICSALNISRSTLYKLSMKYFGKSIHQIIIDLRVEAAQRALVETDQRISEVALSVGIENYNYFTKLFTRETGVSPVEYRKHHQLKRK